MEAIQREYFKEQAESKETISPVRTLAYDILICVMLAQLVMPKEKSEAKQHLDKIEQQVVDQIESFLKQRDAYGLTIN